MLDKINNDLKDALRAKDTAKLSALRMLKADLKNTEIAQGEALKDEDIIAAVQRMAKKNRESIEAFTKGGRAELAAKEVAELKALEVYLPEQLSADEITKIVKEAVAESGAQSPAEMGQVMKLVMPKVKGKADGKLVSKIVNQELTPKNEEKK